MSTRGPAGEALVAACESYIARAKADDPLLAHIEASEKAKVQDECSVAMTWLKEKQAMQDKMVKHEVPCLMTHDINKKLDGIQRMCDSILNKPAPPPPKPAAAEPKKDEPMAEDKPAEEGTPMDTDGAAPEEAPMEQN